MDYVGLESWTQQTRDYFAAPQRGKLAACFRDVSIWEAQTVVIDFEFNGLRIAVDIGPSLEGKRAVELVVRADSLRLDWTIFGERSGSHVRLFSHESMDRLPDTLKKIEDVILKVIDLSEAHLQEMTERLATWTQRAIDYFGNPQSTKLASSYRKAWVWSTHTLVIDFEFNGLRIGVNIDPARNGEHAVDLVLRTEQLGIDWTRFGERKGSHVRVFSHSGSDDLSVAFKRIDDILLQIMDVSKARLEELAYHRRYEGTISSFFYLRNEFTFFVSNPNDAIQRHHAQGQLYEIEELNIIREHAGNARVFYDIGSNVGNHAVFMAKVMKAEKVIAFEANPLTVEMLKLNIALNGVGACFDASYLGMGLGETEGRFTLHTPVNNLGGTRLRSATTNSGQAVSEVQVAVRPLDALSLGHLPDFVKIDVEGMEIAVLNGMRKTIQKAKPRMFIEVDNVNAASFEQWVVENDYEKIARFKRYPSNENFMIAHRSSPHLV